MKNIFAGVALLLAFQASLYAQLDEKVADRLYESSKVLGELLNARG